jgi:subtilisin family serine protease
MPREDHYEQHGGWWPDYIAHHGPGMGGRVHYHYMRDQLLVTYEDHRQVRDRLTRLGVRVREERWEERLGIVLLELDEQTTAHDEHLHVPALVDELHQGRQEEAVPRVAPNHVLGPCTHVMLSSSAPKPTEWQPQDVPTSAIPPGAGLTVGLIDTGFALRTEWFRRRVTGDPEEPIQDSYGRLLPNSGHGTFVAGVVLQYAPGANVIVEGVFDRYGAVNDLAAALALLSLFDKDADVVNMSIGAYTRRDRGMLAFERALDYVTFHKPDLVMVAAAGNDGLDRPCFPAADKRVIGVGAVERRRNRWCRASFSDYGWWVDACAPGVELESTFFDYEGTVVPHHDEPVQDRDELQEPAHDACGGPAVREATKPEILRFDGTAIWSGTSFSAPIVSAAIVTAIADGRDPPEAVRGVIADPTLPRLHNLGTLVNPKRYVRPR